MTQHRGYVGHPWRARLLAVAICCAGAPPAAAQDWVVPSGPRAHPIPGDRLSGEAVIPLLVRITRAPAPTRFTVTRVRLNERAEDRPRDAFRFALAAAPAPGLADLVAAVRLERVAEPGTYVVTVMAAGAGGEQELELTFVRPPAALLRSHPEIRARASTRPNSRLTPSTFLLQAPPGRAIGFAADSVLVELTGPDGWPVGARLRVSLPDSLPPGGPGTAALHLTGKLPLGISRGSVGIAAPQLGETLAIPVQIAVRGGWYWLVVLLGAGILVGWLLRRELEGRRDRLEATAVAHDELGRLRDLAVGEKDEKLRTDLHRALQPLEDELSRQATAARLREVVEAAGQSVERVLREAGEARTVLAEELKRLRGQLGSTGGYPSPVEALTGELRLQLQEAESALDSGLIGNVRQALATIEARLNGEVREAALRWLACLARLDHAGSWSDTRFEAARAELAEQAAKATDDINVGELLVITRGTAGTFRFRLVAIGLPDLAQLTTSCRDLLKPLGARVEQYLPARSRASGALPGERAASCDQVIQTVSAITELRTLLRASIESAAPEGYSNPELASALDEGRFLRAAGLAVAAHPPTERGERKPVLPEFGNLTDPGRIAAATADVTPLQPVGWTLSISAPGRLVVGEAATLGVDSRPPLAPNTELAWRIPGQAPVVTNGDSPDYELVPPSAGTLRVQVEGRDPATGERARASAVLAVHPVTGWGASPRIRTMARWLKVAQDVGAAVLIAGVGFLIFRETFVGDFADCFSAFLWGFSSDIGLAKIQELTTPLTGKQIPVRTQ